MKKILAFCLPIVWLTSSCSRPISTTNHRVTEKTVVEYTDTLIQIPAFTVRDTASLQVLSLGRIRISDERKANSDPTPSQKQGKQVIVPWQTIPDASPEASAVMDLQWQVEEMNGELYVLHEMTKRLQELNLKKKETQTIIHDKTETVQQKELRWWERVPGTLFYVLGALLLLIMGGMVGKWVKIPF